jgi:hypothetical protein
MDEEHSDEYMDDTDRQPISIHEQSECYTCKQYECNEYVRSALARSQVTIREHVSATTQCSSMWTIIVLLDQKPPFQAKNSSL